MKAVIASIALILSVPAAADTYTRADFSGAINPGNANVKAPFSGNGFTQSQPFSGSFVFDDQLIPGAGTINVPFGSFPDIAQIPAGDAFSLSFGPLDFTLADNIDALIAPQIQYKNGEFNGFVFVADFLFQNNWYQFNLNGPAITVRLLDGIANAFDPHGFPTGSSLINAHIDIGNANLTNLRPYVIGGAVPEPAAWALMIAGFGLAGAALRRRGANVSVRHA